MSDTYKVTYKDEDENEQSINIPADHITQTGDNTALVNNTKVEFGIEIIDIELVK